MAVRRGIVQHTVRSSDGRLASIRLTRKLAIAAFCTECTGFDSNPADCTSVLCPLYPFRAKTLRTKTGTFDVP